MRNFTELKTISHSAPTAKCGLLTGLQKKAEITRNDKNEEKKSEGCTDLVEIIRVGFLIGAEL